MAPASLVEPEPETSAPCTERRDHTTRALRSAVAAWFSLHPSRLAPLDVETVERMALRLEGRALRLTFAARDGVAARERGHPWAG
jgi:hypothetical protein